MNYRDAFLGATDHQAYTAIRQTVAGTSEYISEMGGNSLNADLGNNATLDNTFDPTMM